MASRNLLSHGPAPAPRSPVIPQNYLTTSRPGPFPAHALWAQVTRRARCAESDLDPDEWFPVSAAADMARREAAAAIAVCTECPVRVQCLALSLRHWETGQHGVWGGLVAADRARLRRRSPPNRSVRRETAVSGMIVRASPPRLRRPLAAGRDAR
jgi:hypothetical protein